MPEWDTMTDKQRINLVAGIGNVDPIFCSGGLPKMPTEPIPKGSLYVSGFACQLFAAKVTSAMSRGYDAMMVYTPYLIAVSKGHTVSEDRIKNAPYIAIYHVGIWICDTTADYICNLMRSRHASGLPTDIEVPRAGRIDGRIDAVACELYTKYEHESDV